MRTIDSVHDVRRISHAPAALRHTAVQVKVDARTAAAAYLPEKRANAGVHERAAIVLMMDDNELAVRLFLGAASKDIARFGPIVVNEMRSGGFHHIDVAESESGEMLVALSMKTGSDVVFIRCGVCERLGLPAAALDRPRLCALDDLEHDVGAPCHAIDQ